MHKCPMCGKSEQKLIRIPFSPETLKVKDRLAGERTKAVCAFCWNTIMAEFSPSEILSEFCATVSELDATIREKEDFESQVADLENDKKDLEYQIDELEREASDKDDALDNLAGELAEAHRELENEKNSGK